MQLQTSVDDRGLRHTPCDEQPLYLSQELQEGDVRLAEQLLGLLRSISRTLILVALLTVTALDGLRRKHLFRTLKTPFQRAHWCHLWCRRIVRALGIRCTIEGTIPKDGAVVSNHLSYLDILLFAATTPFIMVSKAEVRTWPLLGWITENAGTLYVQRADNPGGQTQTRAEVNAMMAAAYRTGLPVLFFPEGTTTDGAGILPFRRGLFNSIVYDNIPLCTTALRFRFTQPNPGATLANDVCFVGDAEFAPHLFRCLGLRGVEAAVRFGPWIPGSGQNPSPDRFVLAAESRAEVIRLYEELAAEEHYS